MGYTYGDLRKVLERQGAHKEEGAKHEKWLRIEGERVYRIPISRGGRNSDEIPPNLFGKILREAGLNREEFESLLRR